MVPTTHGKPIVTKERKTALEESLSTLILVHMIAVGSQGSRGNYKQLNVVCKGSTSHHLARCGCQSSIIEGQVCCKMQSQEQSVSLR